MQDIYTLSLNDITPENIAQDSQVSSLITALDPELQELSQASLEPLILARIDELPEDVLDLLAWQLHTDFYDVARTLSMKREAVKGSILWHMHKGTVWAIKEALRQLDLSAEFRHWHEDNAPPYTFKLYALVTGDFYRTAGRDILQSTIRRAVDEAKAARSLMADLEIEINFSERYELYSGIVPVLGGEQKIRLERIPPTDGQVYAGMIKIENRDVNLGVDLDIMQELLIQFERRILARIDAHQIQTMNTLEDIKEMLRWKDAGDSD